ncbi:MAG: sigma-70 family RNA polymerase sigma factor [Candidatus Krumholzibacteria bacterium]|nr:sigma-70 family RNA polymerase sigma factor [Candidatus Krumholzibacteria bacterium]
MTDERTAQSDEEIIGRVLGGETDAFGRLVERYREHVFRIVGRRVPRDDAGEVAQDVFVRAFTSLGRFEGRSPFEHWLSKIAVRAALDYWRERYRSREAPMSSLSEDHREWLEKSLADDSASSFEAAESRRLARDLMMSALEGLSPADRAVVELVHLEERPIAEAAQILGLTAVNVKVRAHRARKRLRDAIERMRDAAGA